MRGFALPLSAVNVFKARYVMQQIKLMRHNPEKLRHDSALDVLTLLRLTAFRLHTRADLPLEKEDGFCLCGDCRDAAGQQRILLTSRAWAWRRLAVKQQEGVLASVGQC